MRKYIFLPLIAVTLIAVAVVLKNNFVNAQTEKDTGPCSGKSPGTCRFESQTIFANPYNSNKLQWQITVSSGREYIYIHEPASGWVFYSGVDLTVSQSGLFAQANGPCAGKSPGTCRFDSQTIFSNPYNSNKLQWMITTDSGNQYIYIYEPASGLWGLYNSVDLTADSNGLFAQANGPCAGKAAGTCRFDTQTIFANPYNANKLQWVITASDGNLYNYVYEPASGWQPIAAPVDLATFENSVLAQANGPCAGKAAGTCRFDSQTIFVNSYIGNQLHWVITTDNGQKFNYFNNGSGWAFNSGDDLTSVSNGLFN